MSGGRGKRYPKLRAERDMANASTGTDTWNPQL
jgi:hypothetical protein